MVLDFFLLLFATIFLSSRASAWMASKMGSPPYKFIKQTLCIVLILVIAIIYGFAVMFIVLAVGSTSYMSNEFAIGASGRFFAYAFFFWALFGIWSAVRRWKSIKKKAIEYAPS